MIVFQRQRELKNPWVPLLPGEVPPRPPGEIPPQNIILATPLHISDQGSFLNNSNCSRITNKKGFSVIPWVSWRFGQKDYHLRIQQIFQTFWKNILKLNLRKSGGWQFYLYNAAKNIKQLSRLNNRLKIKLVFFLNLMWICLIRKKIFMIGSYCFETNHFTCPTFRSALCSHFDYNN